MSEAYKDSPFRNLRGKFSENKNEIFFDLQITPESDNTKYIQCNENYIALRWREDSPFDAIAILNYEDKGKHLSFAPCITPNAELTDFAWAPYERDMMACASSDGRVQIFQIPEKGPRKQIASPDFVLDAADGNRQDVGVGSIDWHPTASGIIATGSGDQIHVWDVQKGQKAFVLTGIEGKITDINWNYDGTKIAASARNMVYIFEVRTKSLLASFQAHKSEFPIRLHWAGKYNYVFTSGQNRYENRQVCIFDGTTGERLKTMPFEQGFSALNFSVDVDADILFACGRGDDHLKRFQLLDEEPYCKILTALGGKEHFRGYCTVPKSRLDYYSCEVQKILQVTLHDIVPLTIGAARERGFYPEFYPPTTSTEPALTAAQWIGGQSSTPLLVDIVPGEDNYVPPDDDEIKEEFYVLKKLNIVRSTKYNYIGGDEDMENSCFHSLDLATNPALTRNIAGNSKYFAVPWKGTGGRLGVFRLDNPRRVGSKFPSIETKAEIHDFEFDPFNLQNIAIGCGDATIKLYEIPPNNNNFKDGTLLTEPLGVFTGHRGKVGTIGFHPTVQNVLASSSIDKTLRLWDVERLEERRALKGFGEAVINWDWNYNGDQIVTCAKDRSVKIWDMRSEDAVAEGTDCGGAKGAKVAWLRGKNKIFVVGFGPNFERRYKIMDIRMLSETLAEDWIDRDSGVLTPHYDEDTSVMTLWGKGDTSVKFFEIVDEDPYCHFLTSYNSLVLQSGLAILHKTLVNPKEVEIFSALKLRPDSMQPIHFKVPRQRTEYFQDDIYVPTRDIVNTMSVDQFFAGEIPQPVTIDLNPGMELLSDAPLEEVIIKKFVQGNKIVDDAEVAENTINKLYDDLMGYKEEEDDVIPGDEMSGVDSDEWGDDSSSY